MPSIEKLTLTSYFADYFFDCTSKKLTSCERITAFLATVALCTFSFGIIPLAVFIDQHGLKIWKRLDQCCHNEKTQLSDENIDRISRHFIDDPEMLSYTDIQGCLEKVRNIEKQKKIKRLKGSQGVRVLTVSKSI